MTDPAAIPAYLSRGTDIDCPTQCDRLTERIEGDRGLVPYGSGSTIGQEARSERAHERSRCEEMCTLYISRCKVIDSVAQCENARRIWKNYLFVIENRPTKMEFFSVDDVKKQKRGMWRDE